MASWVTETVRPPAALTSAPRAAEEIRVAHEEGRDVAVELGLEVVGVGHPVLEPHQHELQPLVGGDGGAEHLLVVGMQAGGDEDGAALLLQADRHERRFDAGRAPVVETRVGHLEPRQVADEGLVFEDVLERALADFRLVGGVGREPFLAAGEHVHRGRHEMVIGPGAQEPGVEDLVPGGQGGHLAEDLQFGTLARQRQFAPKPKRGGDALQQIFGSLDADGLQQGAVLGRSRGQVAHGATSKWGAVGSIVHNQGTTPPRGSWLTFGPEVTNRTRPPFSRT